MRLQLAPGPLPALYAAGVPDWIGADGARVGWTIRDRLFLWDGGSEVVVVALPEYADDVAPGPDHWVVAFGNGFVRVRVPDGEVVEAVLEDEREPVACRPGQDVGVFVEVPEHRLLRLTDGLELPLPDAALRARWIRPWETGVGACWVDMDTLYRMGERIGALGKAPGTEGLRCGPRGAVVVALKSDTVVAAARGLAVRVGRRLDAESARFDADGLHALAATEEGVALVDLREGRVVRTWDGNLAPVGFLGGAPVVWDLDRGVLVDGEGKVLLEGFAAAAPAQAGTLLAGPGGAVWDLSRSERTRADLRGGACATDGRVVVHVTGEELRVLDGPTFPHALLTGEEDEIERARVEGDAVVVETLDGEAAAFGLTDGAQRWRKSIRAPSRPKVNLPPEVTSLAEDEESTVVVAGARLPLPADGAARVGDVIWLWADEGCLFAVPGPEAGG